MQISGPSAARLPSCSRAGALQRPAASPAPWRNGAVRGSPTHGRWTAPSVQRSLRPRSQPPVRASGPSNGKGELIDVRLTVARPEMQAHQPPPAAPPLPPTLPAAALQHFRPEALHCTHAEASAAFPHMAALCCTDSPTGSASCTHSQHPSAQCATCTCAHKGRASGRAASWPAHLQSRRASWSSSAGCLSRWRPGGSGRRSASS